MNNLFNVILEKYLDASHSSFGGSELGHLVRHQVVDTIVEQASINLDQYHVKGSVGQTNWAEVPWISIFDREITTTATKGYYIVYLFRADMSGVYLSLNQGWTYFENKYGRLDGRNKIKIVAVKWKQILNSTLSDFSFDNIDLHCSGRLGKGYELGHICGKFYEAGKIPDKSILVNDLRNLIGVYREMKGYFREKQFDEINDLIIADKFVTTDSNVYQQVDSVDEDFQINVQKAQLKSTPEKPQEKPATKLKNGSVSWERDPKVAKEAIHNADYLCELDPNHLTFISNTTGKNFVEAHHLIPLYLQGEFEYSLDVPGNIVSLCPNCHRAIHLATPEHKREIITQLYNKRKEKLESFGIGISFEKLLEIYIKET